MVTRWCHTRIASRWHFVVAVADNGDDAVAVAAVAVAVAVEIVEVVAREKGFGKLLSQALLLLACLVRFGGSL